ncbi:MAG TPA: hypothetical protein VGK33_22145, partial [Chloroflexota bacterium]
MWAAGARELDAGVDERGADGAASARSAAAARGEIGVRLAGTVEAGTVIGTVEAGTVMGVHHVDPHNSGHRPQMPL